VTKEEEIAEVAAREVHPVGTPWWRNIIKDGMDLEPKHIHVFEFLLNNSHTALRGCTICGMTHVGLMAGTEDNLRWHRVEEPPEEP
jgi:hypothetical protein